VEGAAGVAKAVLPGSEFAKVLGSEGDIPVVEPADDAAGLLLVDGDVELDNGSSRGKRRRTRALT
jgi:hypothetical protein